MYLTLWSARPRRRSSLDEVPQSLMVEIRAGEGGQDSKNFVEELTGIYGNYCRRHHLKCELLDADAGWASLCVSGKKAWAAFQNESGKHVVQRCPESERGGRRHTSLVSVAVLPVFQVRSISLQESDLEITYMTSRGPGGQGVNTTNSACRMVHIPTGLSVRVQVYRSQHQNRAMALQLLSGRLQEQQYAQDNSAYADKRRNLLGDGGRGSAARTYNFYKTIVVDHRSGKQTNDIKSIMKGNLDLIL